MAVIVEASLLLKRGTLKFFTKKYKLFSVFNSITRNNHHDFKDGSYDILIAGTGMVGMTLACALAINRRFESKKILLLGQNIEQNYEFKEKYSNRVVALNKNTQRLLSSIGAWKHIEAKRYNSIKKMQIWDGCSDAIIIFNEDKLSHEIAYIVENDLLLHAVYKQLKNKTVNIIDNAKIVNIALPSSSSSYSCVTLDNGENFKAKLLIGADGQKSKVREAMGCEYISWDYDQMGVVATVKLSEKIENYVAWQRFLPTGPVALLPLTETLSSLVWSTNTDEAKRLLKVTEEEFVDSLNDALWKTYPKNSLVDGGLKSFQQILGSLELQSGTSRQLHPSISKVIEGSRAAFPLGFGHSVQYVQSGVVLIGDAAHRVHPLAGQGVNLGFGDVMELVRVLSESTNNGSYLGDVKYLYEYESLRQRHNIPTMLAIDALHRLYNKTDPSLVLLRSIGLQLTNAINPLKKLLMQHAAGQRII